MSYKLNYGSAATIAGDGFDSLSNGHVAVAGQFNAGGSLFYALEISVAAQAGARSSGAKLEIYQQEEGPTLWDVSLLGVVDLDASTSARTVVIYNLPAPPALFSILITNATGQATAASGNTVSVFHYGVASV